MNTYTLPVIFLCLANVVFWFKGISKVLFDVGWSPFKW